MGLFYWILFLVPVLLLLWKYLTRNHDYFEQRRIPYVPPGPIFGSMFKIMLKLESMQNFFLRISNKYRNHKFVGAIDANNKPIVIVQHPDIVKKIGIKDFDNFMNHELFTNSASDDLFVESLFLMQNQKWRDMRATLSPAFTGSKMRLMFDLVRECATNAVSYCKEKCDMRGRYTINSKEIFSRTTVDVISTCAFGLQVDSLREPNNLVFEHIKKVFEGMFEGFESFLKFTILSLFPGMGKWLNISITPKDSASFFKKLVADTIRHRKKTKEYRPDVIHLLVQAMEGKLTHDNEKNIDDDSFAAVQEAEVNKKEVRKDWNDVEIAAQCFIFFTAGYETTSTLLNFGSHELAVNQNIQNKLYEEVKAVKERLNGSPVTYSDIQSMEYLDAFVCEVLRKHPPVFSIDRTCNKDTVLDDGNGKLLKVQKGTTIHINCIGLHYNPFYFENPEKFDPERFIGENKKKIVPNTYLPFGVGPRACIGSRFALMQAKLILYQVLSEFSIEVNDKTYIPLQYSTGFRFEPAEPIIVDLKERV